MRSNVWQCVAVRCSVKTVRCSGAASALALSGFDTYGKCSMLRFAPFLQSAKVSWE